MGKKINTTIRIIFGVLLIATGLFTLLAEVVTEGFNQRAADFTLALDATGYIVPIIAIIELLVGLFFILNRHVALGALLLFPLTINMVLFHVFLDMTMALPSIIFFGLNIFVAFTQVKKYREVLTVR